MALLIARRWDLWPWKTVGYFYPILVFAGLFTLGLALADRLIPYLGVLTTPLMTVWGIGVGYVVGRLIRDPLKDVFFFLSEGRDYIFTYKEEEHFARYRGRSGRMYVFEISRLGQTEFERTGEFCYLLPPEVVLSSVVRTLYG